MGDGWVMGGWGVFRVCIWLQRVREGCVIGVCNVWCVCVGM